MTGIQKHISSFLIGVIAGCSLMIGLYLVEQPQRDIDISIIDELINDWTYRMSEQFYASLQPRHEIPDARPGYIPIVVQQLSLAVENNYHIPKGVVIAQWVLESRWGQSDLGASNYFGHTFAAVRKYMPVPDFVTAREMVMQEGKIVPGDTVLFARYRNISECFETHGAYVTQSTKYQSVLAKKLKPEKFAREMGSIYATDPEYGLKLIIIMRRYKLG